MDSKAPDPFGFDTQGQNYDIYRPKYPKPFVEEILKFTDNKNTYLDLASGTGILFFELFDSFNKDCVIHDRSAKQLQTASEKLKSVQRASPVHVLECDAYEIPKQLPKPLKFDLVTIAQAYHWFEPFRMLDYATKELLADGGALAITGYFCDGFDYNYLAEDEAFSKSGQRHYDEFYRIVKPHFDCDRDTLDAEHKDVDFSKYFETVKRSSVDITKELTIDEFQKYLHTYSGYNLYVNKFKGQSDFVDPNEKLFNDVKKELADFYQKRKISIKEKPINMKMHFFLILAKKVKALI